MKMFLALVLGCLAISNINAAPAGLGEKVTGVIAEGHEGLGEKLPAAILESLNKNDVSYNWFTDAIERIKVALAKFGDILHDAHLTIKQKAAELVQKLKDSGVLADILEVLNMEEVKDIIIAILKNWAAQGRVEKYGLVDDIKNTISTVLDKYKDIIFNDSMTVFEKVEAIYNELKASGILGIIDSLVGGDSIKKIIQDLINNMMTKRELVRRGIIDDIKNTISSLLDKYKDIIFDDSLTLFEKVEAIYNHIKASGVLGIIDQLVGGESIKKIIQDIIINMAGKREIEEYGIIDDIKNTISSILDKYKDIIFDDSLTVFEKVEKIYNEIKASGVLGIIDSLVGGESIKKIIQDIIINMAGKREIEYGIVDDIKNTISSVLDKYKDIIFDDSMTVFEKVEAIYNHIKASGILGIIDQLVGGESIKKIIQDIIINMAGKREIQKRNWFTDAIQKIKDALSKFGDIIHDHALTIKEKVDILFDKIKATGAIDDILDILNMEEVKALLLKLIARLVAEKREIDERELAYGIVDDIKNTLQSVLDKYKDIIFDDSMTVFEKVEAIYNHIKASGILGIIDQLVGGESIKKIIQDIIINMAGKREIQEYGIIDDIKNLVASLLSKYRDIIHNDSMTIFEKVEAIYKELKASGVLGMIESLISGDSIKSIIQDLISNMMLEKRELSLGKNWFTDAIQKIKDALSKFGDIIHDHALTLKEKVNILFDKIKATGAIDDILDILNMEEVKALLLKLISRLVSEKREIEERELAYGLIDDIKNVISSVLSKYKDIIFNDSMTIFEKVEAIYNAIKASGILGIIDSLIGGESIKTIIQNLISNMLQKRELEEFDFIDDIKNKLQSIMGQYTDIIFNDNMSLMEKVDAIYQKVKGTLGFIEMIVGEGSIKDIIQSLILNMLGK